MPGSFVWALCAHTARTLAHALTAVGFAASADGNLVSRGGFAFRIVLGCTALSATILFVCFICSYRTDPRKKVIGLALGIPALYLGNIARLASIFVISGYNRKLFDVMHAYMGQTFAVIFVILLCAGWLSWVNRDTPFTPANRITGFFARFILISGCVFLVWIEIHSWYVGSLVWLMLLGFSSLGYPLSPVRPPTIHAETFSIVAFVGLILSTRTAPWLEKVKSLAVGLAIFSLVNLFHQINDAMMSAFHYEALFKLDAFLLDTAQYLLPVLLWLLVEWRTRPSRSGSATPAPNGASVLGHPTRSQKVLSQRCGLWRRHRKKDI